MSRTYFKNIFSYLTYKYPNTKVFVISDEHFFHENIIKYSRNEFSSVDEMNSHIIERHNLEVSPDDIVIFLGDFCFKNGQIANMTSKLNGHKFLIMGNHDTDKYKKRYADIGFENVFTMPIQFDNAILSHEPIMSESNNLVLSLMKKEFIKDPSLFNVHGHEHDEERHDRSINVCAENIGYRPVCIGATGSHADTLNDPLIIDSENFSEALRFLEDKKDINVNIILADFIYAMMLESIQAYKNDTIFFGSYSIFKKFGSFLNFSDLDGTVLFNPDKSKKGNTEVLKGASESVFSSLNNFPTCNLDYAKRMSGIYILSNYYTNGHFHNETFLDLNMIYKDIYKPSDIEELQGTSYFEQLLRKNGLPIADEYYFPRFDIQVLNDSGDLANLILQVLFQRTTSEQKRNLLKKIKIVSRNMDMSKFDVKSFVDQITRFLIKNIYFFNMVNRRDEINLILDNKLDIDELYSVVPRELMDILMYVVYESNFTEAFEMISKSTNTLDACDEILNESMKKRS